MVSRCLLAQSLAMTLAKMMRPSIGSASLGFGISSVAAILYSEQFIKCVIGQRGQHLFSHLWRRMPHPGHQLAHVPRADLHPVSQPVLGFVLLRQNPQKALCLQRNFYHRVVFISKTISASTSNTPAANACQLFDSRFHLHFLSGASSHQAHSGLHRPAGGDQDHHRPPVWNPASREGF